MPNSQNRNVDQINDPIIIARNLAYQQVQAFLEQNPNKPGETDAAKVPARLSLTELKRLAGRG